jgi:hypothetical protein
MQDTEPAAGERTGLLSMLTLVEALSRALTTTQVAEAVFRHVLPAIGAAAGTLVLRADERDALELVGAVGHSQATLEAFRRIPLDASTPAGDPDMCVVLQLFGEAL